MAKNIRYIIGALVTGTALFDIITINHLQFKNQPINNRKTILTFLKLPFIDPQQGDLVLTMDNKHMKFKIVQTISGKYTDTNKFGMAFLVPSGFFLLKDTQTGEKTLQCQGSIIGQQNFDITFLARRFQF